MTDQKITLAFDPDQLAMIIDGLPTPTLVVDNKNGDVLHLNEEARSYFGFAHDDNSPRKGRDLVGDIERFKAYTAILEKNGEVRGFELTTKKVNGHFFTALVSGRKIFYGESSATLSTVIDITAQKVIETELERKGKLLEQAQSLAAVSGWEWFYDPEARTGEFQISERTATVLGWRPIARSVSSQDLFNLLHPDDLETLTKGLVGVKNKGAPFAFEFRIGDDLGDPIDISYRWVRALGDVTFSEDRLILSITGSVQDITESKNFERQIKETSTRLADSEARFRDYAEVSADWLWETDTKRRLTRVAQSFCDILGKSQSDLLGRRYREIASVDIRNNPEKWNEINEATEAGKSFRDFRFTTSKWDGRPVHISISGKPFYDRNGEYLGYRGTGTNITQLQNAIVEMESARHEADRANLAKSEFLSNMSHELRTPLNAILGFSELLQESDNLTPLQNKQTEYIYKGGVHLLRLINDILDLSKIEAGKMTVDIKPVNMARMLSNCLEFISSQSSARNIVLHDETADLTLPYLLADELRLRQVLLNLLSNAVKYNREGGLIRVHCQELSLTKLRICVTDNGPGIPKQKQHELFQPFSRLGAEATKIEGVGIGLALTKQLVTAMNGQIGVISDEDAGSTFWIDLPVSEILGPEHRRRVAPQAPMTNTFRKSRGTVLYVEDNASNRSLMEILFNSAPEVTLICASDAAEGLRVIEQRSISTIISDINLPGMDGFTFAQQVRQDPKTSKTPLLALSADARQDTREKALAAGFDSFISKPFNLHEMAATIAEALKSGD